MKLGTLQKYILVECLRKGPAHNARASVAGGIKLDRKTFRNFYPSPSSSADISGGLRRTSYSPSTKGKNYQESIITKSLERLIDKELMMGYGRRTPHKWFITHVKLTKKGEKQAEEILKSGQTKLPLK